MTNPEPPKASNDQIQNAPTPRSFTRNQERDAARYRWLRNKSDPDNQEPYICQEQQDSWGRWHSVALSARESDELIDAAIAKAEGASSVGSGSDSSNASGSPKPSPGSGKQKEVRTAAN